LSRLKSTTGELDNLTAQECFALGVEWQITRQRMKNGKPFTIIILANNAKRIAKLAERNRRFSRESS
jgi:hypothetical protein